MTKQMFMVLFLFALFGRPAFATQSTIVESEGTACMGDDKSRKQTEQAALIDAKRRAVDSASTYIRTETGVKNFVLEKDLISAYSNAEVKVLQELERSWFRDPSAGDCCKAKIKAEVVPDPKVFERMAQSAQNALDDQSAPLNVKVWTDKNEYILGEKIKVFIKGNKPFYARVLYKDAGGETIQILPNPYRTANHFNGGTLYEVPFKGDTFELEVGPPFGLEKVLIYAGTSPLGAISTEARGGVYEVKNGPVEIGLKIKEIDFPVDNNPARAPVDTPSKPVAAEFFEDSIAVKTANQ